MGDSRGQGGFLALEGRVARATTQSIHRRVPEAGAERVGAVPAFRGQPETAYKWLDRFRAGCELDDRSRRPHSSPKAVAAALEDAIVAARKERPNWGPKKLRAVLRKAHPGMELPSISTFALIFKRNGLVTPRRKRRRAPPSSSPLS